MLRCHVSTHGWDRFNVQANKGTMVTEGVTSVLAGQSIAKYKSKWRNIWIRDVFCYRIPAFVGAGGPRPNQNTSRLPIL